MRATFGDGLGAATGELCGTGMVAGDEVVDVLDSGELAGAAPACELVPCAFAITAFVAKVPITKIRARSMRWMVFVFIVSVLHHGPKTLPGR
jgi:hypothetical protein